MQHLKVSFQLAMLYRHPGHTLFDYGLEFIAYRIFVQVFCAGRSKDNYAILNYVLSQKTPIVPFYYDTMIGKPV